MEFVVVPCIIYCIPPNCYRYRGCSQELANMRISNPTKTHTKKSEIKNL